MKHFLPSFLPSFLLLLLLTACNKDALIDPPQPISEMPLNCIYADCVSSVNPLVIGKVARNKTKVPLSGLMTAFDKEFSGAQDKRNFALDGYPAWDQLLTIPISSSFAQYLVPVFKADSDRAGAIILFTHYLDHGVVDVDYVYRGKVSRYPAYESLRLANKHGTVPLKNHTAESLVVKFSALDQGVFGSTYDDLLSLLDSETRMAIYNKDCKITTRYLILNCQDITGEIGGETVVLYTDCVSGGVETITTVVTGCDGGNGGPGPTGPAGPVVGGGGSGGGGVSVVNNDPGSRDNRCIEDGVKCEEEEEEEEDDINPREDKFDNRISPNSPCAQSVVDEFISEELNTELGDILLELFGESPVVSIEIIDEDMAPSIGGQWNLGGYNNSNNQLDYFSGTLRLNSDYLACSKDFIRSVLMHEMLHAYIDANRLILTPEQFERRFPLAVNGSDEANLEHIIMGNQYVDLIQSYLQTQNPELSDFAAERLAWVGLNYTTLYISKGEAFDASVTDVLTEARECDDGNPGGNPN